MRALSCAILSFILINCSKYDEVIEKDKVLAYVDNRVITVQDFLRRSEYSIRPDYCRQSNYLHKKIVLNSLIAEKLTSLEMSENDKLFESSSFNKFLKGRKEQAMRQVFYSDSFYDSISIADSEIKKHFRYSGRTIDINYLSLPTIEMVRSFEDLIDTGLTLDSIFAYLWQQEVPSRRVNWFDREPDIIHEKLFNEDLEKGRIIGPFKIDDGSYLVIEVNGWIDQPAIKTEDKELRWNDTKERIVERMASNKYKRYVKKIMSGKKLILQEDAFNAYAIIAGDHYLKDEKQKKIALNQAIWDNVEKNSFYSNDKYPELNLSKKIFNFDDRDYSINDLNEMIKSHPLVFRKRKMNKGEFRSQLKLAIADLLRDEVITKLCYDKGFENDWRVELNVGLWKDAYASRRFREIHGFSGSETNDEILDYLNPIVDSLQEKYSEKIKINMDIFENIEITSTDMFVTQRGLPYPIIVPSFPILTSDNRLDYGSKLE